MVALVAPLGVLGLQDGPATTTTHASPATAGVSVLVSGRTGGQAAVLRAVRRAGGTVVAPRAVLDGAQAVVPAGALPELAASPGVLQVTRDAQVRLADSGWRPDGDEGSLNQVDESTRAKDVWGMQATDKTKSTGTGVGVALIDSGVAAVPGLNAPGKVIDGPDLSGESQDPQLAHRDTYGHGTHMAGIIAGLDTGMTGHESEPRVFAGLAPGAHIVSVKVADATGATDVSQVVAGVDWVVQHRADPGLNIRVLNLSFGTESLQDYRLDPLAHAVENAWRKGIVVVVSAGNDGAATTTLTDPATDPYVIAVGASNHHGTPSVSDDTVADFSSNGSVSRGVDVLAPGTSIGSLRDPGSYVDTAFASTGRLTGTAVNGSLDPARLFRGSGTSQAAAVVSGAAALLVDNRPTLTPDQVKALLVGTARPIKGVAKSRQGGGIIDVRTAAQAAAPAVVQKWAVGTGTGSLEAARGGYHLVDPVTGEALTGEQDLFGVAWDGAAWARQSDAATAWSGGSWLGARWTGDSWSGARWTDAAWTGARWTGARWTSSGYQDASWDGARWTGARWTGARWTDSGWSSVRWN